MQEYQSILSCGKFVSNNKLLYSKVFFSITSALFLFQGCMTSSRQDQLQASMTQIQGQVFQLQEQLNKRDQQINNTTQAAISSKNDVESLQTQLQLTQGVVDALKLKLKRIEENAGGVAPEGGVISLGGSADNLTTMQRQIARVELSSGSKVAINRKGKLPAKLKTPAEITRSLKSSFEQGNYKQTIETSNSVLGASDATDIMLQTALEYRAEAKFKTQDFKGSAIDFSNYIEMFHTAAKYPRALLLAGDSYVYLKNNAIAKSYYQECAKSFANSPEGKAAAGRLASLPTNAASVGQ